MQAATTNIAPFLQAGATVLGIVASLFLNTLLQTYLHGTTTGEARQTLAELREWRKKQELEQQILEQAIVALSQTGAAMQEIAKAQNRRLEILEEDLRDRVRDLRRSTKGGSHG